MERKVGAGTVAVTKEEIRSALGPSSKLTSEEEKALRMRHGVGAATTSEPLPRAAGANPEVADQLLLMEMQLLKAWRIRIAQEKSARNVIAPAKRPSRQKDKIVRSLRKKR